MINLRIFSNLVSKRSSQIAMHLRLGNRRIQQTWFTTLHRDKMKEIKMMKFKLILIGRQSKL